MTTVGVVHPGEAWRWTAEMEQIAATFESVGVPSGFHLAAAEIFRDAS